MHSNRKESFKLLQLSDDSKSLSDLELPELTNQRKRKILRKTRNTSPHSRPGGPHHHNGHDSPTNDGIGRMAGACTNFGLWIAIVMSCGWLLILSYMTAVVYSENRRLEVQVSQLAVTSKVMPDELQQWHETSKWLEQNQTAILAKFHEVDQRLTDIDKELRRLRDELRKQTNDDSDGTKLGILQSSVANFGARIKDLDLEVQTLKEHKRTMLLFETQTKDNITQLQQRIAAVVSPLVNGSNGTTTTTTTTNAPPYTDAIITRLVHNLTDTYGDQLHNLTARMVGINDTLSQRSQHIEDDILEHKIKLDQLADSYANMTSHVTSIENILVTMMANVNTSVVQPAATITSTLAPLLPAIQKNETTTTKVVPS